jgi:hypothetical protein
MPPAACYCSPWPLLLLISSIYFYGKGDEKNVFSVADLVTVRYPVRTAKTAKINTTPPGPPPWRLFFCRGSYPGIIPARPAGGL